MVKIVVLVLTVWNTATGDKLHEIRQGWDRFNVTGNPIEECRRYGVRMAYKASEFYQRQYPFASSNVDCHWEDRPGDPA
jgi:hypothetical protein